MKFELNEHHKDISVEKLILDVQRVSQENHCRYLSIAKYEASGKYSGSTYRKYIGSWNKVLELAGLPTTRSQKDMQRISNEYMIDDIIKVSEKLGKNVLKLEEYNQNGKYAAATIVLRFGTWAKAIATAGLEPTKHIYPISNQELFNEIERIWIELGRQPTTTDIKRGISKYSLDTFMRRFGGFRGALEVFVKYINDDSAVSIGFNAHEEADESTTIEQEVTNSEISEMASAFKHRTSRNINLRFRFLVMQRDNFKCCACGVSPAVNPQTILHVDHIVPWSKGGETELENLQTLCSKCNLGKGDYVSDT